MIVGPPAIQSCTTQGEPNKDFEVMLPTIRRVAFYSFRRLPAWRREELIEDVVAKCFVWFIALVRRGKTAIAYPTVLAQYAIRQVREHRQVGRRQNANDVLS